MNLQALQSNSYTVTFFIIFNKYNWDMIMCSFDTRNQQLHIEIM